MLTHLNYKNYTPKSTIFSILNQGEVQGISAQHLQDMAPVWKNINYAHYKSFGVSWYVYHFLKIRAATVLCQKSQVLNKNLLLLFQTPVLFNPESER